MERLLVKVYTNPGRQDAQITKFCTMVFKLLVSGTEIFLCHPSGIYNFDVPLIFLVDMCTPVLDYNMSRLKDSVCFVSAQDTRDDISIWCV